LKKLRGKERLTREKSSQVWSWTRGCRVDVNRKPSQHFEQSFRLFTFDNDLTT
jgi:hypothetical protein